MNRDPLGEAGGINLYGFVQNDPVNYIDPEGKFIFTIAFGIGTWALAGDAALIGSAIWAASDRPKSTPWNGSDDWRDSGIQDEPGYEDLWPPPDPKNCSDEEKCKQAKEDCLEECQYILERPPRWPGDDSNTFDHATCIAECMERKNC